MKNRLTDCIYYFHLQWSYIHVPAIASKELRVALATHQAKNIQIPSTPLRTTGPVAAQWFGILFLWRTFLSEYLLKQLLQLHISDFNLLDRSKILGNPGLPTIDDCEQTLTCTSGPRNDLSLPHMKVHCNISYFSKVTDQFPKYQLFQLLQQCYIQMSLYSIICSRTAAALFQ